MNKTDEELDNLFKANFAEDGKLNTPKTIFTVAFREAEQSLQSEIEKKDAEIEQFRTDLSLSNSPSYFTKVRQPLFNEIKQLQSELDSARKEIQELHRKHSAFILALGGIMVQKVAGISVVLESDIEQLINKGE